MASPEVLYLLTTSHQVMVSPALPVGDVPLVYVVAGVTDHRQYGNDNTNGDVPALPLVLVPFIILRERPIIFGGKRAGTGEYGIEFVNFLFNGKTLVGIGMCVKVCFTFVYH